MCIRQNKKRDRRQDGFSLIETIIFIIVVGVGVVGLMSAMNTQVKYSADPMLQRQTLAIAEALLEEVMLQPFTTCDPQAYDQDTDTCTQNEAMGPDTVFPNPEQTRYSTTSPYNNVNDYDGFSMTGIRTISNDAISGLENYQAGVAVTQVGGDFGLAAPEDALRIDVTVTNPSGDQIVMTGYRFREPTP